MTTEKGVIPESDLQLLTVDLLQLLCSKHKKTKSGKKDELVARITGLANYNDLLVNGLKKVCKAKGMSCAGVKAVLVERLTSSAKEKAAKPIPQENTEKKGGARKVDEALKEVLARKACLKSKLGPGINDARLNVLTKKELLEVCIVLELEMKQKTSKKDIIAAMLQSSLELEDLTKVQLKDICEVEGLTIGGNKADLIQRLISASTVKKDAATVKAQQRRQQQKTALKEVEEEVQKATADGFMSRDKYRRLLRKHGQLMDDQDVFHIIAKENGGADHVDNYHYAQNAALNRALGCRHDYLNAYLAGMQRAQAAVRVSQKYGNKDGKKYKGPSAEELYKKGEDAVRLIRMENRKWHEKTYEARQN